MGIERTVRDQVSEEEWQIRVDLAACYRAIALYGWDDLVFTHISARVPGGDHHFLILAGPASKTGSTGFVISRLVVQACWTTKASGQEHRISRVAAFFPM